MRRLIFTLITFIGIAAQAQFDVITERRVIFNPVVSSVARTLPQWQVGFQRTSGANINSNILANALSVGVLSRVELGVVPMFLATSPGSFNYTGKLNFYRGDEFDWSGSFTENRFKSEEKDKTTGQLVEGHDLVLRSTQIGFNYHPEGRDFMISPFLNSVCGHIDSPDTTKFTQSLECKAEFGTDVQWQVKDREWLTFAYGYIRDSGKSAYEEMHTGVGVAWSQFRPKEMFSRPSVGVYYSPATSHTLYLISTTFYEL